MGGENPIEKAMKEAQGKMMSAQQAEDQRQSGLIASTKAAREADYESGLARGKEQFGEGSLSAIEGRRAKEVGDIIAQRKAQAQGYTPEERNLLAEKGQQAVIQSQQGALRALRGQQGASGIRGGLAAAQQAKAIQGAQQAGMQAQRDLASQEMGLKREGLGALESSTRAAREEELGTLGREKMAQQATALGLSQLGAVERGAIGQRLAAEKAASASQQGGKK